MNAARVTPGDRTPPTVFLVTNVYSPVVGGITNYVANLERSLRGRFEARVFAYPRILVEFEASRPHAPFRHLLHLGFVGLVLGALLLHRLRGRRVVVHSQSATFCLLAGYVGKFLGARAVHTLHSPLSHRSFVLEWLSPRLDALVFVSPALRETYREATNARNDREGIIPGAVDIPPLIKDEERVRLRREVERTLGVPRTSTLFLYVGRVVEDKGVHVLARAASLLPPNDGHVLVAGPPGWRPEDRRYVDRLTALAGRAAEDGRFRVLGRVPAARLEVLFRACDVVVVPSIWPEPVGMVVAEAMARGRPVVASRTGGLPFIVSEGEAGLLVPPGDPRALVEALRRLSGDRDLWERLSRGARARAVERHSLQQFGVEHARLYSSL